MAVSSWANRLDLRKAAANLRVEASKDWHVDPWSWPEIGYIVEHEPKLFYQNCSGRGTNAVALVDVPKENWSARPAVVMDIVDRITYQALVDALSVDLVGGLSPNVFGWRLPAKNAKPGEYSHNDIQWSNYTSHLTFLTMLNSAALRTDIVSFFASIPIDRVQEAVQDRTPGGPIESRLFNFLDGFQRTPDRSGLPQRSLASSVLANMYLRPFDDVLTQYAPGRKMRILGSKINYNSFTRWMDDVWLFAADAAACRRAQFGLQVEAQNLGLYLNSGKTDVIEGDDVERQVREVEHSAVENAIIADNDFEPLEELIDKLLDNPEKSGRTSINFVSKRMRENSHTYRMDDILSLAARMPHAADAWAKLFKENVNYGKLIDWYLDYTSGNWATFEWSIAQFARMFPSGRKPRKALRELFSETVQDANTSLPLLAVVTQRLCAWDPYEGRAACRNAFKKVASAQARRILALSALGVGEARTKVRSWLEGEKENYPTLRMLEYYNFAPVKIQDYFAS